MRKNSLWGDTPFRRTYIRSMVDGVEVDDVKIRIIGRKAVLADFMIGGRATASGVPGFVRKWRTRHDSNM